MWIFMPSGGFISVVQKVTDVKPKTLTIRVRTKADLIELRKTYLPALGPILEDAGTDYPYRAVVTSKDFAEAMATMGRSIGYQNYKDEVSRVKGPGRARIYHALWSTLLKLQRP